MKAKNIIIILLALAMVLSLTACSTENSETTTPETTPEATTPITTPEETPGTTTPEATTPEATTPVTTPESSAPESSTESAENEYPKVNYMDMDLSQYITLGQYKGLTIEIENKTVVDDAYAMSVIKADLISAGYTEKITNRTVTKDDTVSISYKGLLNGVAFAGGTGEKDYFTIYDGGGFIPGFAEGVIGATPGTEVDVNVTFPEKYHSADLAGKAVVFKVTVHHIYEAKELTDSLASEATNEEFKTAAELVAYYKEFLTEEVDEAYKEKQATLVWDLIRKNATVIKNPVDVINAFYDYEIKYYEETAKMYGIDVDTLLAYSNFTRETLKKAIAESVFSDMIIYSIIKAEGLTLTAEEYEQFIKDTGYTEDVLLQSYSKEELENIILAELTREYALEWQTYVEPKADAE